MIPKNQFEIRLNNNLTSYREFYGKKLTRNTSRYSYASNITTVQFFYGIGRKTSLGVAIAGRTTRLSGTFANFSEVYNFRQDTNATFYLRTVSPVLRFNMAEGYFHVRMQTFFNIPTAHVRTLKYKGVKLTDENPFLLGSEWYIYRYFSEYVKMVLEIDVNFKFDDQIKSFTVSPRSTLYTIFSLPVNKVFRIYGLLETTPTGNTSAYFNSYYFKEGTGIKARLGKDELTLYYSYYFLGKSVNAFNSLVLNFRIVL